MRLSEGRAVRLLIRQARVDILVWAEEVIVSEWNWHHFVHKCHAYHAKNGGGGGSKNSAIVPCSSLLF